MTPSQERHASRMRTRSTSVKMTRYKVKPAPISREIAIAREKSRLEALQRIEAELRRLAALPASQRERWHGNREDYLEGKRDALVRK